MTFKELSELLAQAKKSGQKLVAYSKFNPDSLGRDVFDVEQIKFDVMIYFADNHYMSYANDYTFKVEKNPKLHP